MCIVSHLNQHPPPIPKLYYCVPVCCIQFLLILSIYPALLPILSLYSFWLAPLHCHAMLFTVSRAKLNSISETLTQTSSNFKVFRYFYLYRDTTFRIVPRFFVIFEISYLIKYSLALLRLKLLNFNKNITSSRMFLGLMSLNIYNCFTT